MLLNNDGDRTDVTVELCGFTLRCKQFPLSGEHSLTVWDSSIVLIKYFERHIHWFRKLLSSNSNKNDSDNNKRSVCVELGAGTGALPSLAAAIIAHNTNSNDNDKNDIYQKPLLIITDQVQVLPFTRRNLEVNIGQIRVNNDDNNGSRNMKMMPEYCVMEMDWTKKSDVQQVIDTISRKTELNSSCQKNHSEDHDHETNTNTTEKNSDNNSDFNRPNNNTPHVDVVLASDCVYNESLIQPFINTIEAISDEKTVILIAHEKRCEIVDTLFESEASRSFSFKKVCERKHHRECRNEHVVIYIMKKKKAKKKMTTV